MGKSGVLSIWSHSSTFKKSLSEAAVIPLALSIKETISNSKKGPSQKNHQKSGFCIFECILGVSIYLKMIGLDMIKINKDTIWKKINEDSCFLNFAIFVLSHIFHAQTVLGGVLCIHVLQLQIRATPQNLKFNQPFFLITVSPFKKTANTSRNQNISWTANN
jgi:hypothetical protein